MGIVTAHGVAAHSQIDGATARLQRAMEAAILQCNAEGITNTDAHAGIIRARMHRAHQQELIAIKREDYARQVEATIQTYQQRRMELDQAHHEHLEQMALAHTTEMTQLEAELVELEATQG